MSKRRISAWLLLLVFVPVMVATSLHIHEYGEKNGVGCEQCAQHIHHDGHFNAYTDNVHDCVLCQLSSLPFVAASTIVFSAALLFSRAVYATFTESVCHGVCGDKSTRAPPLF